MLDRETIERWKQQGSDDPGLRVCITPNEWKTLCDMALRSLPGCVADGFVRVPVEPTKEMLIAGEKAVEDGIDTTADSYQSYEIYDEMDLAARAYKAMLAAAPGGKDKP